MLAINTYDEFGKPATGNIGRFQYTGQAWIPGFGVYDYKARMYHPGLGRFVQPDPIGYWDSANLYAYVLNDPVNLTDPTGLIVCLGSHINTDSCANSSGPLSCSGDCRALGGSFLTINEQRKNDEAFDASCPDVFTCDLLAPGQAPPGGQVGSFRPLSPADQRAVNALLGHPSTQSRVEYAWVQTLQTGDEHGFFVWWTNYVGGRYYFTLGAVYRGRGTTMGDLFTLHATGYRLTNPFWASVHVHTGTHPEAFGPSLGDVSFGRRLNSIVIIRTWNGFLYGR